MSSRRLPAVPGGPTGRAPSAEGPLQTPRLPPQPLRQRQSQARAPGAPILRPVQRRVPCDPGQLPSGRFPSPLRPAQGPLSGGHARRLWKRGGRASRVCSFPDPSCWGQRDHEVLPPSALPWGAGSWPTWLKAGWVQAHGLRPCLKWSHNSRACLPSTTERDGRAAGSPDLANTMQPRW